MRRTFGEMRKSRINRRMQGLVEIHHIIPKSLYKKKYTRDFMRKIKENDPDNLMFLPTAMGNHLHKTTRYIHGKGPHAPYNKYVERRLKLVRTEMGFRNLMNELRHKLTNRHHRPSMPWY